MSTDRMPTVYPGHGAPPLVDDPIWPGEPAAWARVAATQPLPRGRQLAPRRDEGVLIMGSGFLPHGRPFLPDFRPDAPPPGWSPEFDAWAAETVARGDVDELVDYRRTAPGLPYA